MILFFVFLKEDTEVTFIIKCFTCNELVQELGQVPETQLVHAHVLELTWNVPVGHELAVG
jgi:hypothetical protein